MNVFSFYSWDSFFGRGAIVSIILTTLIVMVFAFFYWYKLRNKKGSDLPTGFLLLLEIILLNLESTIVRLLGKRYRKITPYFFYLLLYINLGNFISMFLGIDTPFAFFTVVFSLGLITFFGIYYFGLRFEGWRFFIRYLNPLEFISQIASLISISFRLFGNILAGIFILTLVYKFLNASELAKTLKWFNILAIAIAPLHFYFDVFSGTMHSFIFILLTITYWSLSKPIDKAPQKVYLQQ